MMWEAFAGLMLAAFCGGMLAMWPFAHRAGQHDGYEEGRADRYAERIAENRRGRHERTGPRTSLAGSPPALPREMTDDLTLIRGYWRPRPGSVPWGTYGPPSHISAAGIAPVILPEPGSYPPQAGRDSGDGTLTLPKIRLELATTGEIRAIGDEMVAAIEAAGEAS